MYVRVVVVCALCLPLAACYRSPRLEDSSPDGAPDADPDGQPDAHVPDTEPDGAVPDAIADADADTDGAPDADQPRPPPTYRKMLFVMDQSASLQCTDVDIHRRAAVQELVADSCDDPAVSFAYVGFHTAVFTAPFADADSFLVFMEDNISQMGPASDFQGALARARDLLAEDMAGSNAALRAETAYEVYFFADGLPEPLCTAGCEDDQKRCIDGLDNDGDGAIDDRDQDCSDVAPDDFYGAFCNERWWEEPGILDPIYVDAPRDRTCFAYNTTEQILEKVSEIVGLAQGHGAYGVTVNTFMVFNDVEVTRSVCPCTPYVPSHAGQLLASMADAGGGAFTPSAAMQQPDPPGCVDEVPFECDSNLGHCGGVPLNSLRQCWEFADLCEDSCQDSGGMVLRTEGELAACVCPGDQTFILDLGGCRSPEQLCEPLDAQWAAGGYCACPRSHEPVAQICMWHGVLEQMCRHTGGRWTDDHTCNCRSNHIFAFAFEGCTADDLVAEFCEAKNGKWDQNQCHCPDGSITQDGDCR